MKPNTGQADVKDNQKTLPLPEVKKKLGSSPYGLSHAKTQKWKAIRTPKQK
ncbi:hypothetical protein PJI16_18810 [Nitrospira sp. MA-1]|nr:hypothetical protein [Nitrospira sp. MA-1]